MDIKDLRKKRKQLESDIAESVSAVVEEFKKETGFSPRSIYVGMVNVTQAGSAETEYVVSGAKVDIEI